jgi:hypothetical protein
LKENTNRLLVTNTIPKELEKTHVKLNSITKYPL